MTIGHTIDPRIPQHLIPVAHIRLSTLYSQHRQLSKLRIERQQFCPVLGQGHLCSGIWLLTNLQEEA